MKLLLFSVSIDHHHQSQPLDQTYFFSTVLVNIVVVFLYSNKLLSTLAPDSLLDVPASSINNRSHILLILCSFFSFSLDYLGVTALIISINFRTNGLNMKQHFDRNYFERKRKKNE